MTAKKSGKSGLPRELEKRAKAQQQVKPFFVVAKDENGKEVKVFPRSMTRSQLRALREKDLDPMFWQDKRTVAKVQVEQIEASQSGEEQEQEAAEQAAMLKAYLEAAEQVDDIQRKTMQYFDAVIDLTYPEYSFDLVPQNKLNRLAQITYQMTVGQGQEDDVKNS